MLEIAVEPTQRQKNGQPQQPIRNHARDAGSLRPKSQPQQPVQVQVRQVEDNEFYELVCKDCWAKLGYGHAKTGGKMYAKRMEVDNKGKAVKDDNGKGKPLPHKGWCKYNKETGKNE